jgi:hypothetical protein
MYKFLKNYIPAGFEPGFSVREADVMPLSHVTRVAKVSSDIGEMKSKTLATLERLIFSMDRN